MSKMLIATIVGPSGLPNFTPPPVVATPASGTTTGNPGSNNPAPQQVVPTGNKVVFPATVWRNNVPVKDTRYDVTYDPAQGGANDHPAYGWYYQPQLPSAATREAHEVALTLRGPASYRFTGPECQVFQNYDGQHPFDQGKLLIDRQNVLGGINLSPNNGNEVWLFVKCNAGAASGFSFEALQKLP